MGGEDTARKRRGPADGPADGPTDGPRGRTPQTDNTKRDGSKRTDERETQQRRHLLLSLKREILKVSRRGDRNSFRCQSNVAKWGKTNVSRGKKTLTSGREKGKLHHEAFTAKTYDE